jgi:RNA polymerase sigma factor (sigma-70 family)
MRSDAELLREFTERGSEPAFTELVQRHVDLVYSAALRQVGLDDHLARDVAQLVFLGLARKATKLADRPSLAGWLYTSTHYAAANIVRAERRRRTHELRSHMMHGGPSDNSATVDWDRLRPVLDAAMLELSEHDREIVVQRFFGGRSFAEIGANLNMNEDTARKRAERALDKLHPLLARRGIRSTSEALALALLSHAVPAAPSGLATALSAAAMSNAVVPLAAAAAAPFFTMSKLSMTVAVASLALLGGTWIVQQKRVSGARAELSALNAARATLAFETSERRKQVAQVASSIVRPSPPSPPSAPTSPASNVLARLSSPEQIRVGLDGLYAPLFRKFKFPADRLANFKELLVRKRQASLQVDQLLFAAKVSHSDLADSDRARLRRVATREIDDQIRTFLGPIDAHTFDAFERTLSVRTMFTSPAALLRSTPEPLRDDQIDTLVNWIVAEFPSPDRFQELGLPELWKHVLRGAAPVVSPLQFEKLARYQRGMEAWTHIIELNRSAEANGLIKASSHSHAP